MSNASIRTITIIVTIRCLTLEIKIFQLLTIFQSTKILIINKIVAINVQSSYTKIQNKISLTLSLKNITLPQKISDHRDVCNSRKRDLVAPSVETTRPRSRYLIPFTTFRDTPPPPSSYFAYFLIDALASRGISFEGAEFAINGHKIGARSLGQPWTGWESGGCLAFYCLYI